MERCHTRIKVKYHNDLSENSEAQRYDKLQKKFDEFANKIVDSDDNLAIFWNLLNEFQMKKDQQFKSSDHLSNPIRSPIENCHKTSEECNTVHSPMVTNTEEGIINDMMDKRIEEQYTLVIAPYTLDSSQVTSFQQLHGAHFQYLESYNFISKFLTNYMYNVQGRVFNGDFYFCSIDSIGY
ncbi:hypothetical protein TorRG33x02_036930 [Trema orientale]|uniref:Uncharacterized protein n=1 Tax=Trema orientale TaxID=63057 RepID=A0A2P5FS71_TREOI|nr:hypothetical protein TorRG33x02_036930 [Trema orientale]